MKSRIFTILLFCVMGFSSQAQNTPNLSQTAVPGTVTVIQDPVEPKWGNTAMGQPAYPNYITSYSPMISLTDVAQLGTVPIGSFKLSFQYTDGFNRAFQTVSKNYSKQGPTFHDLIGVSENISGTIENEFLPFTKISSSSNLYPLALGIQKSYYAVNYPQEGYTSYTQDEYASDGSMRETKSYAPGKSQVGQKNGIVTVNGTNGINEVRLWEVNTSGLPISVASYAPNQLTKITSTLATTSKTITYTDKSGNVVLKMVSDNKDGMPLSFASTYYVYDDFGKLRFVIPPKAVAALAAANWALDIDLINGLCFQYRYDEKGRLFEKRNPGEDGFTEIVYDQNERVAMRRNPLEAAQNQWEVLFYDGNGRVLATSIYGNAQTQSYWQGQMDAGGTFPTSDIRHYIVENSGGYPPENLSGNAIMSYTYYDNYSIIDPNDVYYNQLVNQIAFTETQTGQGAEMPIRSLRTQGMVMGSKTRILPATGIDTAVTGDWRLTYNYYDDKGRPVYAMSVDQYHGQAIRRQLSATQFDFAGRMLISKHLVTNYLSRDAIKEHTELIRNTYDPQLYNLLKVEHKVDADDWKILAAYEYDDMNRVKREVLGNYGEVRDYAYDIRGQMTGINGDYAETGNKAGESRSFGQSLKYDHGFAQDRNDGKLAGMIWRGSNGKMHAYGYDYDANGRLVSADYRKYEDQIPGQVYGWSNDLTDRSVSGIEYDKNGNLLKMVQKGPEAIQVVPYSHGVNIDDLTYAYQAKSNRLDGVADAVTQDHGIGDFHDGHTGTDYAYDANGNLTMDLNKGIASATFTRFNKPSIITMNSGGSIVNSYDAGGNKIQEKIIQATHTDTTDYLGNFVYRNGALSYINTATGRTVFENDGTTNEEYFVKDNLGNIRTVVDVHEYPVLEYLSSYELASANLEGLFFDHQDEVRDDKPGSTDPSDTKAGRLNGNDPERRIGTAMMLKVMAGDKLELNVNSYYNGYESGQDEPVSSQDMLESVVGTLTNGVGGLGGEAHDPDMVGRMFSPENWDLFNEAFQGNEDPDKPKAFLNYILFSEDGTVIPDGSGRFQANGDGTWMPMGTQIPIVIPANGYMGIFLSDASKFPVDDGSGAGDVYFDLLKVRFSRGNLKEENHYYPFGLPMGDISGTASGFVPNRHRYQGNEYVKDLGVNWMDFHARQYDPQIGRFLGVDPLADGGGQERFSPYAAMGDNPGMMVDPAGMQWGVRTNPPIQISHVGWMIGFFPSSFEPYDPSKNGVQDFMDMNIYGSQESKDAFWSGVMDKFNSMQGNTSYFLQNDGNGNFSVAFKSTDGNNNSSSTSIYTVLNVNVTAKKITKWSRLWSRFFHWTEGLFPPGTDVHEINDEEHSDSKGGEEFKGNGQGEEGRTAKYGDSKSENIDNMMWMFKYNGGSGGLGNFSYGFERFSNFMNAWDMIANDPASPISVKLPRVIYLPGGGISVDKYGPGIDSNAANEILNHWQDSVENTWKK